MKKKLFLTLAIILCFAVIFTVLTACTNKEFAGKYYKVEGGVLNGESWIELTKNGKWTDDEGASGTYEVKDGAIDFYENDSDEILLSGTISGDDLVVEFWGMESHYRRGNPGDSATETPDGGSPTTYYTVTFNSMGGSEVASVQVAAGTKIAAPATPTKDRYNFSGWYKDAGCTTAWDFSTDVVNGDITLYANWVGEDGKILAVANATISDYNIFMPVQRDVDYVSLADAVTIGGSGTWRLYRDILGSQEIPTKIAAGSNGKLSDGNNIFYIVSTSSDGQQVRTYTLTVHRSYAVSVTVIDPYGNPSYYNSFYTYFDRVNIDKNFPGYTVNGWTCSDPEWGTKGYITDSATFTPSCTPNTYTVTLDSEGGTISSGGDTKSVTYDSGYSLPVPSKTGYSFLGWYCQGSLKTDSYGSSLSDWNYTYDTTFYAQWEINDYYLNARSSDTDAGTVTGGGYYDYLDGVTITATTNPGYTFIGWYEGGTKLTGELSYTFEMPAGNKTYTAKWIACPVTLGVNDENAGSVRGVERTVLNAQTTITATTNPGYTFIGWYEGETKLTGELTYSFTMTTESKTYTAKWIACPVTLLVEDRNAGIVSGVEGSTRVGEQTTITAATNLGYTFIGWYEGETKLTGELSYTFAMPAEDKTYTAKWVKVDIVSEDSTKGTVSQLTGTYMPGDRGTVTATTNPGYTFIGWYEGENKLTGELSYTFEMPAEDKTYTAKWIKVDIVSEDEAKGMVSELTETYILGQSVEVDVTTNSGYTFIGLYCGEEKVSGDAENIATFTMPAENKTYTARWEPTQYSVNLIVSGDTVWKTETAGIGSALNMPDAEEGMSFYGWLGDDNEFYSGSDGIINKDIAQDRNLYARFYQSDATPVATGEELQGISLSGKSSLVRNIDLGGAKWTPIGTGYNPFTGTIYGNGYTVSNFKITTGREYVGLFGYNEGVIQNLGVENFTVNVRYSGVVYAGGLVGYNDGGNITNCYATGEVSATSTSSPSSSYAGGLAGYNIGGSITNCYATGNVSATSSSYPAYAGGLVGFNWDGNITNCYATGDVRATSTSSYYDHSADAGGLVGYNWDGNITNCYATGEVSATSYYDAYAGGLVGVNSNSGSITNCYRYSGQTFYRRQGSNTYSSASNNEGTAEDLATLQSVAFHASTLGWDASVWNFAEGTFPTLKNVGTVTAE